MGIIIFFVKLLTFCIKFVYFFCFFILLILLFFSIFHRRYNLHAMIKYIYNAQCELLQKLNIFRKQKKEKQNKASNINIVIRLSIYIFFRSLAFFYFVVHIF